MHFNYEKPAIINTDASEKAIKAWLQQVDNEKWKQLIACYTQKLTLMKQWYDVYDRKMLAIIEVLEWWKTCQRSFEKTSEKESLSQAEKVWIS